MKNLFIFGGIAVALFVSVMVYRHFGKRKMVDVPSADDLKKKVINGLGADYVDTKPVVIA